MTRYVHTVWCDDIRQEVGNKPSLMGVYTGNIVLPALPYVLPRLSAFIWLNTPVEHPFRRAVFRMLRDDGVILAEIDSTSGADLPPVDRAALPDVTRTMLIAGISLGPLEIPAGCAYLKSVVQTDDGEHEGPKLRIQINPSLYATANGMPAPPGA